MSLLTDLFYLRPAVPAVPDLKYPCPQYLPYLCEEEWRRLHDSLLHYSSGAAPLAGPAPADQRPLARVVWYYGDLVTLWTTAVDGVPPEESLLLPGDRLTVCLRAIAVQVKVSQGRGLGAARICVLV